MQSKHLQTQYPWESVSKHLQIQRHALMIATALTNGTFMQLNSAAAEK